MQPYRIFSVTPSGRTPVATSAVLAFLLSAVEARAQGSMLSGRVTDELAAPLSGCRVDLKGPAPASDTSDAQGRYSVARTADGILFAGPSGGGSAQAAGDRFRVDGRFLQARDPGASVALGRDAAGPLRLAKPAAAAVAGPAAGDSLIVACPGLLEKRLAVPANSATLDVRVERRWDLVVYGGTSAGVVAAVQARRMGKSVLLVSPERRLGGLSSGGLGETDIGNKAAIGGLSRDFYRRIAKKYQPDSAWAWQTKASYARYGSEEMWTFEPKVALAVFHDLVREHQVPVLTGERLDLARGVAMDGPRLVSLALESGRTVHGRMFIDATYEGDLMAEAGVDYHVGREANSVYGETFNGIQVARSGKNQLPSGISPYAKAGDPSSGLLPGVLAGPGGADGAGDRKVQAYNFRVTLTDVAANRVAVAKPGGYVEAHYEILFRMLEAGLGGTSFFKFDAMPNRKTDSNNNGGFSTDFIGMNWDYPDGDYATRARIHREHEIYTRGLLWTLANHPRVPQAIRDRHAQWGLPKDEFTDNGNFSPQLYVREARRMIGAMVMTQKHVTQALPVTASVGMGAYTMDSHHVQRHVSAAGYVTNEGDVQEKGFGPYPIDLGAIVPKPAQAVNLLVPVCLSASHIAYGSIRMEPVFMVLGQSAATVAAHALDEGVSVQEVDYPKLKVRLLADRQVLTQGTAPEGITVDDLAATLTGTWTTGSAAGKVGGAYRHDGNTAKGAATAEFTATLQPGRYEVRLLYVSHANRAANVPVRVLHSGGEVLVRVDQRDEAEEASLGTFEFGTSGRVRVSNEGADGYVVIDGATFIRR